MRADRRADLRDKSRQDIEDAQTSRLPGSERASLWRATLPSASTPPAPPAERQRVETRSRPLIVPASRTGVRGGLSSRVGLAAPPGDARSASRLPPPLAVAARVGRVLRTRLALHVAQWLVALAVVAVAALALGVANNNAGPAGDAVRLWEGKVGVKVVPPNVTPPGGWQGYDAGTRDIIEKIALAFGPDSRTAQDAVNVAWCESNFDPQARNTVAIGGSHAEGLFQILWPGTWNTTSQAAHNPFDPDANILAAHELWSRDGQSWVEWTCQP